MKNSNCILKNIAKIKTHFSNFKKLKITSLETCIIFITKIAFSLYLNDYTFYYNLIYFIYNFLFRNFKFELFLQMLYTINHMLIYNFQMAHCFRET